MPRTLSDAEVLEFRQRLCNAAAQLFIERGASGFTIRQVAQVIGCSPMTPYRYFKDKDEILAAVRATAINQFCDQLELASSTASNARARAAAVGDAYFAFALDHPGAYRLIFDMLQPEEDRFPELVAAMDRSRQIMTGYVRDLVSEGELQGDPVLLGTVLWSAIHGILVLHLAGKLGPDMDVQTLRRETQRALMRGFSGRSQAASND